MSETLVIELLGAIGSIIASYSLVNWRLQKLEQKVDAHNAWGEKFAQQNTDIAVIKNDIGYIKEKLQ